MQEVSVALGHSSTNPSRGIQDSLLNILMGVESLARDHTNKPSSPELSVCAIVYNQSPPNANSPIPAER